MQINNLFFPHPNKSRQDSKHSAGGEISQAQLNDMLAKVTRVRVFRDGVREEELLGNELLLDISDPIALERLKPALQVVEPAVEGTFAHCMCYGDFAFEFFSGQHCMAVIALHHGRSLRWSIWNSDAKLKRNLELLLWCAENGAPAPLEAFQS